MSEPVLLFGIGATKAGTSWLYRYLAGHPDCALRAIKELHFFDTADDQGARKWYLKELERSGEALARKIAGDAHGDLQERVVQLAEIRLYSRVLRRHDEAEFLDFLEDERTDERVVGDITPAYALLPAERLAHMAGLRRDVRFVYLMRDPVDRLWSHVRMIASRREAQPEKLTTLAAEILDRALNGEEDHIIVRGDYRATLEKLAQAVDPARVFLCTVDDLFGGDGLMRLCDFLGIRQLPGEVDKPVHAGARIAMTGEQKARAAAFLAPQYDYVATRMGGLPPGWAANMAGV